AAPPVIVRSSAVRGAPPEPNRKSGTYGVNHSAPRPRAERNRRPTPRRRTIEEYFFRSTITRSYGRVVRVPAADRSPSSPLLHVCRQPDRLFPCSAPTLCEQLRAHA